MLSESSEPVLELLRNELGDSEGFSRAGFNDQVFKEVSNSLDLARDQFRTQKNAADRQKDARAIALIDAWGGEESFVDMRRNYANKTLESLLMNRVQFVSEWNNRLIRKTTPIYQVPRSRTGRAQMFSPVKRLGPLSIGTYWFNMVVIWLTALVLYITLVYDILRKFTNWQHVRKLRKK